MNTPTSPVPGLVLRATAAARRSLDLAGAGLEAASGTEGTGGAGNAEPAGTGGWLRVIGAGRELRRADVDVVWPDKPVRVQHRSGALWTLNSAALAALAPCASAQEQTSGQFWRAETRLRELLPFDTDIDTGADLETLGAELAALGITHVTDATPDVQLGTVRVPQHVLALSTDGDGPRKIVLSDHEPPDLDAVSCLVRQMHAAGRGVAFHAVTAGALAVAIAALDDPALDDAAPNGADRIEHAAVCSDGSAARLAELGVTVVTQPSLPARHGRAYLADSEPGDRGLLWRYAGLLRLGVTVAMSSDAPYGWLDPWRSVRAAVVREWADPASRAAEAVSARTAFDSLTSAPLDPGGPPRVVSPGSAADLVLFDTTLDIALERAVREQPPGVRATFIDGRLVSSSP